jgi:ribonuclease Z
MKPTFHARRINSPFEDPGIFVRIERERRALLFDLGSIGSLGQGNLLKVSDVFVTHMHIDHFIGFDVLLRAILRREVPVRIFGPEHITACVEGKLRGYTWNLIGEYPVKIEVFEVTRGIIAHAGFYAAKTFERVEYPHRPFEGVLIKDPLFAVKAITLSHDIAVLAFSLEEEYHININKAMLNEKGLPVGPWLARLKRAIRDQLPPDTPFEVEQKLYTLNNLLDLVTITKGQKICYVMDSAPTDENLQKIIPFVDGADTLFCEAYFLERDIDRARERNHLTAALAGRIARESHVGALELLHFSPKYIDCEKELYEEAMREFKDG